MIERRRNRSDEPATAARLYLEAVARRNRHSALVLADADGLLVVGIPSHIDTEAVAAVAPLAVDDADGRQDGLLALVTRGQPMRVWPLVLEEAPYFLAAVGGADTPGDAPEALQRILA